MLTICVKIYCNTSGGYATSFEFDILSLEVRSRKESILIKMHERIVKPDSVHCIKMLNNCLMCFIKTT